MIAFPSERSNSQQGTLRREPFPPRLGMDEYVDFIAASLSETDPAMAARQKSIEECIAVPFRVRPSQAHNYSANLFWDIDPDTLDFDRHKKYVVARVLEYGTFDDWRQLQSHFRLDQIIAIAQTLRTLDPKALSFLCAIGNVSRESFRCFHAPEESDVLRRCRR